MHERPTNPTLRRRKVLVLDIDYTVVDSFRVNFAERQYDRSLAIQAGLPRDFFADALKDFAVRDFDLANMAEAILLQVARKEGAFRFTPEACLSQLTIPHHEGIIERERFSEPYRGVRATLEVIRSLYPNVLIIAHTDCPSWLAILRLHKAGLLDLFDGVMGVATQEPTWLRVSEYANCLAESHRWVEKLCADLLAQYPNVKLLVGAEKELCKPSHVGLQVVLSIFQVVADAVLLHVDDKPHKGAAVVKALKETGTLSKSFCLHAAYGYKGEPDPTWPPIDHSLKSFGYVIPHIIDAFGSELN